LPPARAPPLDERAIGVRCGAAGYAAWSQWSVGARLGARAARGDRTFPYLLSVHIRTAEDHDDGKLAGGYFLLLEHVENVSPGFIAHGLRPRGRRYGTRPRALGRRLYELLVGRRPVARDLRIVRA